jgi:hypothetical protein
MSDQTTAPLPKHLIHELSSESTLPLLNFLLKSNTRDTVEQTTETIHSVTAGIGIDKPPPIPDESEQFKAWALNLIKNGPGGSREKILGNPTVSIYARLFFLFADLVFRLPSLELECPAYVLATNSRKPASM